MSRTSRGVGLTLAVSIREILELEHSSLAATSSIVRPATSRSFRSSVANRRRPTVGVRPSMPLHPSWRVVHPLAREALRNLQVARRVSLGCAFGHLDQVAAHRRSSPPETLAQRVRWTESSHKSQREAPPG